MPISRGSLHSLPDGQNHQKEREIRERLKSRGALGGGIVEVRGKENWKLGIDKPEIARVVTSRAQLFPIEVHFFLASSKLHHRRERL
jgi:hypothetical protein